MEWPIKKLADVCDLQNGFAFKSKDYTDNSNTLNVRMSNIRPDGSFNPDHNIRFLPDSYVKEYASFLLKEGDLVIAMTDMAGEPKILGLPTLVGNLNGRHFLMNQRVGKLFDFSDDIYIPYLRYYLSSPIIKEYYKSKGTGGLQINISKKDVLSADIPLPLFSEQKRIVAILDQAFVDLEQARAKTEQNLKNARDLFDSYLQQVFSQDREVAAKSGWVTKYISDVICKTKTVDPRKSPESEFLYVDVSGVSNQTLEITDSTKLAGKDAPSRARRVITEGDIIFATVRPTLRRIAVVPSHLDGEVCSTGYFVFQPKSELYNRYLYYFLQSDTFMVEMEKLQKGASYPAVNDSQVKSRLISYPSIPEQKRIVETLDSLNNAVNELKATYTKKLNSIDDLKKSILQKAFSGELTTTAT
jgi:type I restriction enzyme S subunit